MPQVQISDAIAKEFGIDKTGRCQCGRPSEFIHCPYCGSTAFYALKAMSSQARAITPRGNETSVRVFSCRACLQTFPEDSCTRHCKGKPTAASIREDKVVHKLKGGQTTLKFEQALLEDYFKLHPERRPKANAPEVNKVTGDVGFLERANAQRVSEQDSKPIASVDSETAKLFEPPVLDNGAPHSTNEEEDKS